MPLKPDPTHPKKTAVAAAEGVFVLAQYVQGQRSIADHQPS